MIEGRELLVKESDTEMDAVESPQLKSWGRKCWLKWFQSSERSHMGSLCQKLHWCEKEREVREKGEHAGVWIISTWRTHCQPQHGLQLPSHKRTGRAEASANPQKTVTWVNQKTFRQHPAVFPTNFILVSYTLAKTFSEQMDRKHK